MGSLADLCASEVITQRIDKAYEEGYNKAIDEFAKRLKDFLRTDDLYEEDIDEIAEKLKEGAK